MNDSDLRFYKNVACRTATLLRKRGIFASEGPVYEGYATVTVPRDIGTKEYRAELDSVAMADGPAVCAVRFFDMTIRDEIDSAVSGARYRRHAHVVLYHQCSVSCVSTLQVCDNKNDIDRLSYEHS